MTAPPFITLNGNAYALEEACSVVELLERLNLAGKPVVIEYNGTALLPVHFISTRVSPGDSLEIVSIVAGG